MAEGQRVELLKTAVLGEQQPCASLSQPAEMLGPPKLSRISANAAVHAAAAVAGPRFDAS